MFKHTMFLDFWGVNATGKACIDVAGFLILIGLEKTKVYLELKKMLWAYLKFIPYKKPLHPEVMLNEWWLSQT